MSQEPVESISGTSDIKCGIENQETTGTSNIDFGIGNETDEDKLKDPAEKG